MRLPEGGFSLHRRFEGDALQLAVNGLAHYIGIAVIRREAEVADEAVEEGNEDSLQWKIVPLKGEWCGEQDRASEFLPALGKCQVTILEVCKGLQTAGRGQIEGCVKARLVLGHLPLTGRERRSDVVCPCQ